MAWTAKQGKEGKLVVGAGDTEVKGLRTFSTPLNWNSEDVIHMGDDAPVTLLNYKQNEYPGTLTEDKMGDPGQLLIFDAAENGTTLAFKYYPDNAVTAEYWSGTATVPKWEEGFDASKIRTASFTFKNGSGVAFAWVHA
jgi:hypothetical protein